MKRPPGDGKPAQGDQHGHAVARRPEAPQDRSAGCRRQRTRRARPTNRAKTPIRSAPSGTSARLGLAVAGARRKHRANRDADREHGEAVGHHAFAAADAVLDEGRQQRQRHEADHPEPRDDVRAAPQAPVRLQLAQQRRSSRSRDCVSMTSPGAAGPASGMSRANTHEVSAKRPTTRATTIRHFAPRPRPCRRRWCRPGWQGRLRLPPARCRRAARRSRASPAGCRTSPARTAPPRCRTAQAR